MAGRGEFTPAVADKMKAFLGRPATREELRLLPYIQYTMMNGQRLEPIKMNEVERGILRLWKDAGYMEGGMAGLAITRKFWDFMNDVLFDAYVAHEEILA